MGPSHHTLPQAATESAREARKSFFCELCQKGYARSNEFEAHENSYDHQHRKRLKDLRQMTKDPNAAAKARESERKANEAAGLKSIDLASLGNAGATTKKKKPVFKSTLQPHNAVALGIQPPPATTDAAVSGSGNTDATPQLGNKDDLAYDNDDPDRAKANGWAAQKWDPKKYGKYKLKRKLDDEDEDSDVIKESTEAKRERFARGGATDEEVQHFWFSLRKKKDGNYDEGEERKF